MSGNKYLEIHKRAGPYLNTRKNDVHVSISYDFAHRLLTHYPDADKDIVLPAVLLHDVGWKMVPEKKQFEAFGPKRIDKKTRRLHEMEGARIAREILNAMDYEKEKIDEIAAIINGHDSRKEAISLNDKLVKDADKLWRFTPTGIKIDQERFGITGDKYLVWLGNVIDEWFFTAKAKEMARKALSEAKKAEISV